MGSNDAALCGVHLQLGPREALNRSTELGFTPALEKELDVWLLRGWIYNSLLYFGTSGVVVRLSWRCRWSNMKGGVRYAEKRMPKLRERDDEMAESDDGVRQRISSSVIGSRGQNDTPPHYSKGPGEY